MNVWDLLQWPAMVVSVVAAWLVAAQRKERRGAGFYWFLASNVLWIVWGLQANAYGLVGLQLCLAGLNLRGLRKNDALPATNETR